MSDIILLVKKINKFDRVPQCLWIKLMSLFQSGTVGFEGEKSKSLMIYADDMELLTVTLESYELL